MPKRVTKGRREREARKRHRRARVWCSHMGAGQEPLKLGRKKMKAFLRRTYLHLSVADHESITSKRNDGVTEHVQPVAGNANPAPTLLKSNIINLDIQGVGA